MSHRVVGRRLYSRLLASAGSPAAVHRPAEWKERPMSPTPTPTSRR